MKIWEIINSPIILTILSLVYASFITSRITSSWQKKKFIYELKMKHCMDIFDAYHKYFRFIKGNKEDLSRPLFDEIHSRFIALVKIDLLLFKSKLIAENWEKIAQIFATIRDLKLKEADINIDKQLEEIRIYAKIAIYEIYKILI